MKKEPKLDITKEQQTKFLKAITDGVPLDTALKGNNISRKKFYFWKKLAGEIKDILDKGELNTTECFFDEERDENTELMQKLAKKRTYAQDIVKFIDAFNVSKCDFISTTVSALKTAEKNEWQKYAWLLERLNPQDFGRKDPDKQEEQKKVNRIKVEYVDSSKDKSRLEAMEKIVKEEVLGKQDDK